MSLIGTAASQGLDTRWCYRKVVDIGVASSTESPKIYGGHGCDARFGCPRKTWHPAGYRILSPWIRDTSDVLSIQFRHKRGIERIGRNIALSYYIADTRFRFIFTELLCYASECASVLVSRRSGNNICHRGTLSQPQPNLLMYTRSIRQ
jgi:hypothetical protein